MILLSEFNESLVWCEGTHEKRLWKICEKCTFLISKLVICTRSTYFVDNIDLKQTNLNFSTNRSEIIWLIFL